jgi:bifunctional DNA-binding transcriptional regulator/antitoxin component of YhaV-PrlF toxin-antitoxin module
MTDLRQRLAISAEPLRQINQFLTDPNSRVISEFLEIVEKHGGPEAINRKACEARELPHLLDQLTSSGSPYSKDLEWLTAQRDAGAFVSIEAFREEVLGATARQIEFDDAHAVTLEISSLQFFPWLIREAKQAIERRQLMPGRFIRVRNMAEQVEDQGDTLAVAAAMQIVGASYVETLDTKGTDGSNIHLGGPETITGYFGGVGQPNDHPLKWVDEFLGYYTRYGIQQVLNLNPGTVFLGYLLHKLGVDIEFKISVYMGNDNPFAALWTLLGARLFAREDGTTSLIGFNWANSVNNATIEKAAAIRQAFGLEDVVRFEHHITETQKSIVIQPYDRTEELTELADHVANISAKHEGGTPVVDAAREHPSDILDYFLPKAEIEAKGLMAAMERNYLDKHDALNETAVALTKKGLSFLAAQHLHA